MSNNNNLSKTILLKAIVTYPSDGDPMHDGRVQVYIPTYHKSYNENLVGPPETTENEYGEDTLPKYPWAYIVNGTQEPPVASVVLVAFEGNDISEPVIVGTYMESSYAGTGEITGNGYSGGTLAELAYSVIFSNEGNYTSVNWNDNGSISIGKIQWNANAGRAKPLMVSIRNANSTNFDEICKKHGAEQLITEVTGNNSWNGYKYWTASSPIGKALIEILGTEYSAKVQDEQALKDVQSYLDNGKKAGMTDPSCLIYYADIENQWGAGGAAEIRSTVWKNLDDMHAKALSSKYGQYSTRRKNTYNKIKELKSQGKLEPNQLSTIHGSISGEHFFLWPTPDITRITSNFGPREYWYNGSLVHDNHNGIDIGAPKCTKILCSYPGKVVVNRYDSSYGNYIVVQGDEFATLYAHMNERSSLPVGSSVNYGDYLGPSGTTGASTGYHLHFSIFHGEFSGNYGGDNSKFVDPLTLISTSNTIEVLQEKIRKAEEDKKKKEDSVYGKVSNVVRNICAELNKFIVA